MLLVAIGRIAQFALLLLTLRLATSFLPPAELGKAAIVTATAALFSLLLINPVGMFMNRRLHAWDLRGQAINYITYFWHYLLVVSVFSVLALTALIGLNIWNPSIGLYWLLFLVCGNLVFGTLNQFVIPGLNLLGHRGWFIVLTVSTAAVSLIFAVVLVLSVSQNAEYWISGLLVGQLVVGLIGKKIFFGKLQRANLAINTPLKLSHSHFRHLLAFSWPVAIAVGLGWIHSQGYRYLMEERLGLIELGLFVAGFGISSGLIAGFDSIFTTYFQPRFYKNISKENIAEQSHAWFEYAKAILPSLLMTGLFIMAMAPELTQLILGPAYRQSAQFVVWGAMAELARTATGVFGLVAHVRMNTKMLLVPNLAGAVASVLLILFLIPVYGSNGVGLGLVFSSLIALLLSIGITVKHQPVKLPYQLFIKSVIMGCVLIVLAKVIRQTWDSDGSLVFALMNLSVIGAVFMLFQYLLILPVLQSEKSYSDNT